MARLIKWLALAFTAVVVFGWVLLITTFFVKEPVPEATTLRVVLDGPLPEAPVENLSSILNDAPAVTLTSLCTAIRSAARDPKVKGLVLEVKNPRVGVAQLLDFESAMAVFRKSGKWNVAFMETAGEFQRGDGTLALAATASKIVLSPAGDVNLTGIRAEVPFFKNTIQKLDFDVHVEKRHEYKNALNVLTEEGFTPEHKEALKTLLDDVQAALAQHLATRREREIEVIDHWIQSSPFLARDAVEKGIVDELAYWDSILAAAAKAAGREDSLLPIAEYIARTSEKNTSGKSFALIVGEGEIIRGGDSGMSDAVSASERIAQAFRDARDHDVAGVLFRISSPGGSYTASDIIRREVELTRKAGIPVAVSMGNVAASGGYLSLSKRTAFLPSPPPLPEASGSSVRTSPPSVF